LEAAPGFMLVVSYNPGYQRKIKELKPSTRQRFVAMSFAYPPPDVEAEIIEVESGVEKDTARRLAALGHKIRGLEELGLAETVSTRLLVYAAKAIAAGVAPRRACRMAVAEPLSDDADVIESIADLAALAF
ncbi:MAG: CbbQ/NirQ/NorQ C-terminal domain-containing protein, partial [Myxococcales bacterium]|nr:CbbQ/NirQ/NorQ C-terminal domain-containing protein [Myxococcales bacterium]